MNFWKAMFEINLPNMIIFIAMAVTSIFIVICCITTGAVRRHLDKGNNGLKRFVYQFMHVCYNLSITLISIFPLLGMLGTVISLINLGDVIQNDSADMNAIKSNFFLALTSTAWGIISSVFFKIIISFFQPSIEGQIERAKNNLENIGGTYEK